MDTHKSAFWGDNTSDVACLYCKRVDSKHSFGRLSDYSATYLFGSAQAAQLERCGHELRAPAVVHLNAVPCRDCPVFSAYRPTMVLIAELGEHNRLTERWFGMPRDQVKKVFYDPMRGLALSRGYTALTNLDRRFEELLARFMS